MIDFRSVEVCLGWLGWREELSFQLITTWWEVYPWVLERRLWPTVKPQIQEKFRFSPGRIMGVCPYSVHVFCRLVLQRRPTTVSTRESCRGYCGSMGYWGQFLWAIRSLYNQSESCIHILSTNSNTFSVSFGLHQGWALSPILFVIFMDMISRRSRGRSVSGLRTSELHLCYLQMMWFCWLHYLHFALTASLLPQW